MSEAPLDNRTSSLLGGRFGLAGWTVDPRALTVTRGEETRHLEIRVMMLLVCLANRPGEVMTRRELEECVWPDVVVGYGSLTKAVRKLRSALDDDSCSPRIIETIPKVGYRLIAEVQPNARHEEQSNPVAAESADQDTASPGGAQPAAARSPTYRRLPIITVVLLLLLSIVSLLAWRPWAPDFEPVSAETMAYTLPDKPSIAVLPFDNLSGDPEQGHLSDGLTENIVTELSRFREFFVISRSSTMVYKDNPVDIRQVAEDLGVRYVLEGSVQTDGNLVRITAQLNDAINGVHVWAEQYDRELKDIFQLQDEITRAVVTNLHRNVELAEFERVRSEPVENLEAYELEKRAFEIWLTFTKEANREAKQMFEEVLEMDSVNLKAHVGLSLVHLNGYRYGWSENSKEESLELAFKYAKEALSLDPREHHGHWMIAKINKEVGNLEKASVKYEKAIELNPNDSELLAESADLLVRLGRPEEAISRVETAMRLNPRHAGWYYWAIARAQHSSGQCEAAVTSLNKMGNMSTEAMRILAAALVCLDRREQAQDVMKEVLTREPDFNLKRFGEYYMKHWPKDYVDRYFRQLRVAGAPEE